MMDKKNKKTAVKPHKTFNISEERKRILRSDSSFYLREA